MELKRMRIIFINDWFSEGMGYSENCLPKAVASLGHEVHVVTSNAQVYFDTPAYKEIYEPFLGPPVVDCGTKEVDGYTLHRLPHSKWRGRLRIKGLGKKLFELCPDIVQTFESNALSAQEAALVKGVLGYKLFLECHIHASVFPSSIGQAGRRGRFEWLHYAGTMGRFVSYASEKCYPISPDSADIAVRFFGVRRQKVEVCSLGVDTELFRPPTENSSQQARMRLREEFGFSPVDVVCIYTGRFSEDKGPLCLAQAIGILAQKGNNFRGLFIGRGTQADVKAIQVFPGCVTHEFVPFEELPPFYWAADIGVWPKQESTSQLDAAACGLPIIISNRTTVRERFENNGLTYQEGDPEDLARRLEILLDPAVRKEMGDYGAKKISKTFSWKKLAQARIMDYERSCDYLVRQ